jgi:hypothetical protein
MRVKRALITFTGLLRTRAGGFTSLAAVTHPLAPPAQNR